jgi:hypothetical protein
MEQAEFERIREQLDQGIRERFAGAPIDRVEVLQYGDDPEIEPGQLLVRVVVAVSGDAEERLQEFDAFHDAHRETFCGASWTGCRPGSSSRSPPRMIGRRAPSGCSSWPAGPGRWARGPA